MDKSFLKDINILYVEDEDVVRELTSNILSKFVKNVIQASNGLEGLEVFKKYNVDNLYEFKIDVIVTDINMPKLNGLEMIEEIEKLDSTVSTLITTAHNDSAFLQKAINQRVRGYVNKPLKMDNLIETLVIVAEPIYLKKQLELVNKKLSYEVEEKTRELQKVIDQLEEKNSVLTYKSTHDPLTTLANRQKLNDELDKEILREIRYQHKLSILMLDIDDFKNINDTYGHDVGDVVLIGISKILKDSIRVTDIASRWGGEEFMVLLPETTMADTMVVAEHIRKNIEDYEVDKIEFPITVSVGVVEFIVDSDDKESF
ncbi:MAG: diguanylate cyclase, partial [Campylobacterota bacterium]|nr:diguanylate cyclase [Campylobacterota bacterium]